MRGPLPSLIRDLSVHDFFRRHAIFPINRGQDLNAAAKILLMEYRGGFTNTKKKDLDRFVASNSDAEASEFQTVYASAETTLNAMTEVFDVEDKLLAGQAQLPVYYQFIKKHHVQFTQQIRPFFVKFEEDRRVARAEANAIGMENISSSSRILVEYNGLLRSPDDRTKQERMFNVLETRFAQYRNSDDN